MAVPPAWPFFLALTACRGRIRAAVAGVPAWWAGGQFAGDGAAGRRAFRGWWLMLAVAAGLLFFGRLGTPLQEPQEVRYAEIPRQMLATGNGLVPVLHGQPYLDKPPLLYWLVMGCYRLFGPHDWAARLVPGAAGFLTVCVVAAWARQVMGSRVAFLGGLVLCLSPRFVYLARLLTMDTLLCLWVTAALAAGHVALHRGRLRWGWWLASASAGALGLLTKGPVVFALAGVPLLAFQVLDPRAARPRPGPWLAYLGVAGLLAAPWFVAVAVAEPGFLEEFFWRHHVVRYVAPFDHEEPAWFYLPGLVLGMLPWALLLPWLVVFLVRRGARAAARRPAALGFCLLAAGWGVLFYSLSGCKRAVYVLPAMPPLALALGCCLAVRLPGGLLRHRSRLALGATLLVLAAGAAGGLASAALAVRAIPGWRLAGLSVAAAGLVLWRGRRGVPWGACAAATFLLLLVAVHVLLPGYARRFSMRGQVRPLAVRLGNSAIPVACYPRRWDSVSFYLGREDVRVFTPGEWQEMVGRLQAEQVTLLFVKHGAALEEVRRNLPGSLEFVPLGRQGNTIPGLVRQRPLGERKS